MIFQQLLRFLVVVFFFYVIRSVQFHDEQVGVRTWRRFVECFCEGGGSGREGVGGAIGRGGGVDG